MPPDRPAKFPPVPSRPAGEGGGARRLFVAVFPDADNVQRLREMIGALRRACPRVRWVRPEAAHFTLAFLGETLPEGAERAASAARRAGAAAPAFRLAFGGAGAFDSWERPRVLWIGLKEGAEALARLASRVRAELVSEGVPFDPKPFVSHLTLGRVGGGPAKGLREELERAVLSAQWPLMETAGFDLVSSQLTPEGPVYSTLVRQRLKEG